MKFIIKDSHGNDLKLSRVSLMPNGIELVVDASVVEKNEKPVSKLPAPEQPKVESVPEGEVIEEFNEIVDAEGLPWDERIHSSNHKQTAKGVWSRRRNLEEGVYDQVKAEILNGTTNKAQPQSVSTERPTPKSAEVSDVAEGEQAASSLSTVSDVVESTAKKPPMPKSSKKGLPKPGASLPEGNTLGDDNDSQLSDILSTWGSDDS